MNELLAIATKKGGFDYLTKNESEELNNYTQIVKAYEDMHYTIAIPQTVQGLIELKMFEKKLKQKEAAKLLETTQAKISLIICGHLDDFSIERLTHYLMCLNQDVDIVIRPAHREKSTYGRLKVVYV